MQPKLEVDRKISGWGNLEHRLFLIFLAVCAMKENEDERRWILVASSTIANVSEAFSAISQTKLNISRAQSARLISRQMIIAKNNVFFTKQRNTTIIVTQDDLLLVFYTTVSTRVAKIEIQEF